MGPPQGEDPALLTVDHAPRRHRIHWRADMPLLGGIRPPIAILLCLLLAVAATTVLSISLTGRHDVPQATRDSESAIAADAASSLRTSVEAEADAVRHATRTYKPAKDAAPSAVVRALLATRPTARGAGLFDPRTGHQSAAGGETLSLAGVDVVAQDHDSHGGDIPARLTRSDGVTPRLLFFSRIKLPDAGKGAATSRRRTWLLVVSEPVSLPPVHGEGRTVRLIDVDGNVLNTGAAGTTAPTAADRALAETAADTAHRGPRTDTSGSLLGERAAGRRTLAGWAPVVPTGHADATRDLGLTVLTSRQVASSTAGADHVRFAAVAAAVLVLIALLVTVVLTLTLQRPLLRLHLSATRLVRGAHNVPGADVEQDDLTRPVPLPRFGEPARIGRALESIRRQLTDQAGPARMPSRRRLGSRSVLAVCAVLIAAWALPMLFLINRAQAGTSIPAVVVADQQARTQSAADRVRQSLDQRYTDLTALTRTLAGRSPDKDRSPMQRVLDDHPQYRSLYVLDRAGAILERVGAEPLRTITHTPTGSGITTVNTSGRIPSIAAYAQIPPATPGAVAKAHDPVVLFGEIDVHALDRTLSRPSLGNVWLTDQRHRVLAANVGFRAFQTLPDHRLTQLAVQTEGAAGTAGASKSAVLDANAAPIGKQSVASAAPLALSGPAAGLDWRVVSARPAASLRLTAYQVQWRTMLAGLLALSAGVACLGWLHIVAVRPLRALATLAERLAGGDRRTVLYPVNHDETGSVTRSLELLRQALAATARPSGPGARLPVPSATRETAPRS